MKANLVLALLLTVLAAALAPAASAANCFRIAEREAASRNAEVLSARPSDKNGGAACVIKLRIPGKDGRPPRVETVTRNG